MPQKAKYFEIYAVPTPHSLDFSLLNVAEDSVFLG